MDAINFIHKHAISHWDIKAENFVFEDPISDNIKLIDFGLCSTFIPLADKSEVIKKDYISMKSCVGSPFYMAPEVY